MRSHRASLLVAGLLTVGLQAAPVAAQVDASASEDDSGEITEELVVYGTRPGDQVEVDPVYEEIMRQQMMDEVQRMRLEEEAGWRDSNLNYQSSRDSRIVWGSDPGADRDMREDFERNGLPADTTKPATLFRAQF
jgi:hypothetical protein